MKKLYDYVVKKQNTLQINITSTIYLVAVVQAILLIIVILRKPRVLYSEKYLIAVLGMLAITLLHYVVLMNQLLPRGSAFFDLSAVAWLSVSPLLYLYSRSLVDLNYRWHWRQLIYFPFSLYLAAQMILWASGIRYGFFLFFEDWNAYTTLWILMYLLNSLVFTLASIRVLTKANLSDKQRERIKWLVRYFKGFTLVLVLLIVLLIYWLKVNYFFRQLEYLLLIFYAFFVFSLIIFSLRFSHYFSLLSNDHYGYDQKKPLELEALYQQLKNHVEKEQPYLNSKLSLTDLAKATNISENQLSQIFTRYLNSNFYNFVNQYRLEAFEQQLREKGTAQYTIMALAETSGFSSKATFYKVFKAHYQMTPTEFMKKKKKD
ncbi:MAG: helix-turn-helix domain-containing protein [Bacteroidota bacterium]